jgi:hypothetical protein
MTPIQINRRPLVPCFGNNPSVDIEFLRRMRIRQCRATRTRFHAAESVAAFVASLLKTTKN